VLYGALSVDIHPAGKATWGPGIRHPELACREPPAKDVSFITFPFYISVETWGYVAEDVPSMHLPCDPPPG
jgi:hypothetical protein